MRRAGRALTSPGIRQTFGRNGAEAIVQSSRLTQLRSRGAAALARRGLLRRLRLEIAGRTAVSPVIGGAFCVPSEPFMVDLLSRILPAKPGLFVDVGVNLGQTLLAVKSIDRSRAYLGFEPNPDCAYYAERLIAANGYDGCTIVPAGLSDRPGLAVLHRYARSSFDSSASIVTEFRPGEPVLGTSVVPLCTFAQVVETGIPVQTGVVKIDVEGAELEVLRSMEGYFGTHAPWVIVEVLPPYRADNEQRVTRIKGIEALLDRCDYVMFRIEKDGGDGLAGLRRLDVFGIYDDVRMSDYVFVPRRDMPIFETTFRDRVVAR